MSGIVALLRHAGHAGHDGGPIDRDLLARMTAAQRFRGPDGEATWIDPARGEVGFGHTLHKATLEAERERQPAARGGRWFLTADARIDARDELCAKLRARGIEDAREDATDPELILQAYEAWGEQCVEHLLGDFSFALWDARERKLFCAVDQLGVKPFFYANRGGVLACSNSLECVRMHPGVSAELNEVAVGDFLMFGWYEDRDVTIYRDVARLAPGHVLVVQNGELRTRKYFDLPEPQEVFWKSEDECLAAFREVLAKAVRDRLRTPKVAICMSGGVDSTLVAQEAKRELRARFGDRHALEAFTVVYDSLMPDTERRYAGIAAEALGIPVKFDSYDDARLFDWRNQGRPPEPMYWPTAGAWLREVGQVGARHSVLLSGWDGDALLLSTLRHHWRARLQQGKLGSLCRDAYWYVRTQHALPPIGLRTAFKALRDDANTGTAPHWLARAFAARIGANVRWSRMWSNRPRSEPRAPARHNLSLSLWGRLLTHEDASVTRCALESRHPLLDLRAIAFALSLQSIPWCVNKELLRRSMTKLPPSVSRRPKTPLSVDPDLAAFARDGLGVAPAEWGSGGLDSFVDVVSTRRALERPASAAQLTEALRIVGFGLWLRQGFDGSESA